MTSTRGCGIVRVRKGLLVSRRAPVIAAFLVAVLPATPSRADVVRDAESIFSVDGLMIDGFGPVQTNDPKYFSAQIKSRPLVDPRRPMIPRSPRSSAVMGSMPPQGRALERLRAAETYAEQQDWRSALNELQMGMELEPNNLLMVRKAAAYAALARRFGVADEYFRRVVEAFPDNVPYVVGRAGVLIRLLRLGEAQDLIRRALALKPDDLAARFNEVFLQIARGDADIERTSWDLLTLREVEAVANWLDADRQDYITTLTEAGFNSFCAITLGEGTRGRLKEIIRALQDVTTAGRLRRWTPAEEGLRKIREMGVRAVGLDLEMARNRFEAGDAGGAEGLLRELADRHPDSEAVLYNHAFVLIQQERYAESAAILEKARELDPADPQIAFALACAYAGDGQMDRAWPLIEDLASRAKSALLEWVKGDKTYLAAIRDDPRYAPLIAAGPAR